MDTNIAYLINKMCDRSEEEAYSYADKLADIGTEEVLNEMVNLLKTNDLDSRHLAARVLGKMKNNSDALAPLMEAIHDKANKNNNGALVQALEGFDLSSSFVDILRIYLFGNFKSSAIAKQYLDYVEFDISPRAIKKAEKHLSHFENNISKDNGEYNIKKLEVEGILEDMRQLFRED